MDSDSRPSQGSRGRWTRYTQPERQSDPGSPFTLSEADTVAQQAHFSVARDQIEHDFVISHVLAALATHADQFVFYGGTALSRTFLDGLRLSEDIDLLSVGPRRATAALLDDAIRTGLERGFGRVTATPWLAEARRDTTACNFQIGDIQLKIQLIDGRDYTAWPRQLSTVSQRYTGLPDITLTTYTAEGFAGAKTAAWCDTTRNAPRDLYDLWAMADSGLITANTAAAYRRHGPTGGFPQRWAFPKRPPTDTEWHDALGHQCNPKVSAAEAYETVVAAWEAAVNDADHGT